MSGILLDTDYKLQIRVRRDAQGKIVSGLVVNDRVDQDAAMVLELSQGELQEDLLLGCGLTVFVRGKYSPIKIERRIKAHFNRAGIDYEEYKEKIGFRINK